MTRHVALAVLSTTVVAAACSLLDTSDLQSGTGGSATTAASAQTAGPGGSTAAAGLGGNVDPCGQDMADCNNDGDCETSLADDMLHCGACNYLCEGEACVTGSCRIITMPMAAVAGVAVDANHIYLSDIAFGVWRLDRNGSTAPLLWQNGALAYFVHTDDNLDTVYWTGKWAGEDALFAKAKSLSQTDLATVVWTTPMSTPASMGPGNLTVGANLLLWANWAGSPAGDVLYTPLANLTGGITSLVMPAGEDEPLAVAGSQLDQAFWVTRGLGALPTGEVKAVLSAQQPFQVIQLANSQARPRAVQVQNSYVYWTNMGLLDGVPDGSVARVQWTPIMGSVEVLSTGHAEPAGLELDVTHVYWTNGADESTADPELWRVELDGAGEQRLAVGISTDIIGEIALDGTSVYWTVFHNTDMSTEVWRRSKSATVFP